MAFIAVSSGSYSAFTAWTAWSRLLHWGAAGVCNSSGFGVKSLMKCDWTSIQLLVLEAK